MSLFSVKKSSRRNIRKRVVELEEEENGGEGEGGKGGEGETPPTLERTVKSLAVSKVGCDVW